MSLDDITLVIAIDRRHLQELKFTYPTWHRFKNEILQFKRLIIYDKNELNENDFKFIINDNTKCVPWSMDGVDQREEMLSSFILAVSKHVTTKWYLKLDVDAITTKSCDWIDKSWFADGVVFAAQKWGYSKPSNVLEILDNWGDTVEQLKCYNRLDVPYRPDWGSVHSKRIISWCFFGNTEWTKFVASLCGDKLPFPSQDTMMYYVAARMKKRFIRLQLKLFGWQHLRLWNLKRIYSELDMESYVKRNNIL